ncbi:MAG TPA: hypothetical protein VEC11_01135 [Allosphingosinicella sp.]|nr:hypothetical protein [Allosphingosinicella sp.]
MAIQPTLKVLADEYSLFWPGETPPATETDYFRKVALHGQAALCLSGGGIRSASFALGIMQGLSRRGVLGEFHYVSSVSGGGYINAWLQRWIYTARQARMAGIAGMLARQASAPAAQETAADLPPVAAVVGQLGEEVEPDEIRKLRKNSNFITPRIGIASNDTWTAIAMSLRNVLTNWFVFGPLLLLVALVPNLFYHSLETMAPRVGFAPFLLVWTPLIVAGLAAGTAAWNTIRALPSYRREIPFDERRNDNWHSAWIVVPFTIWAVAGTFSVAPDLIGEKAAVIGPLAGIWPEEWPAPVGLPLALATLAGVVAGFGLAGLTRPPEGRRAVLRDLVVAVIACAAMGAMLLLGPWLFERATATGDAAKWQGVVLALAGPLWLLTVQLVATVVFVALRSPGDGVARPDDDREWLARLSAIKLKLMLLWALAATAALLLNLLLERYLASYDMSLAGLLTIVTGMISLIGGKSGESDSGAGGGAVAAVRRRLSAETTITVATILFAMLLLLLLARVEIWAIQPIAEGIKPWLSEWMDARVMAHWVLAGALLVFLRLMIWRIDINRFSLNGLYRNRLARAFLGAVRIDRHPDPFTGFDAQDNVRLHRLKERDEGEALRLYPVINVALNVTATENLAWQERKAEPFVFTPLYSGSIFLDADARRPHEDRRGAFVASADYGGRESDLAMPGTGVSLATAMSISGAAASPNMGYHSSAATAFLMTLFNVRLGAWMSNPAVANAPDSRVQDAAPANALLALLSELAGTTHDRGRDIYLSDGGHFENLGLYEMLRRGCPYIVVSDAGCDPECKFADLGNAVRKAKIDLNVDIHFAPMKIRRRGDDLENGQLAWAIGDVTYPRQPDEPDDTPRRTGKILYLKPSYFNEDELPRDIVAYARMNATFPHETTADQFFSESQFESYRKLGFELASALGGGRRFTSLKALFEALEGTDPPAPVRRRRGKAEAV